MLNVVSLLGRLTADPELKHTPQNVAVTTFTLAVNRSYVKQGAERQADFFDVVAWRNTAEFICKYFKKGNMMALSGSLQTRTYTDKEGKNRKVVEVHASNVFFTEARKKEDASHEQIDLSGGMPADEDSGNMPDSEAFAIVSDDDDLPF